MKTMRNNSKIEKKSLEKLKNQSMRLRADYIW